MSSDNKGGVTKSGIFEYLKAKGLTVAPIGEPTSIPFSP